MDLERGDSTSVNPLGVDDDALIHRRLEVGLRNLGYTAGVDEFLQLYGDGHPSSSMMNFVESASDEGFPLSHVIAALRVRNKDFL